MDDKNVKKIDSERLVLTSAIKRDIARVLAVSWLDGKVEYANWQIEKWFFYDIDFGELFDCLGVPEYARIKVTVEWDSVPEAAAEGGAGEGA